MSKKNIIFIIGSLRKNSFNRRLAEAAARLIEEQVNVSFLSYEDLPYMNQDIEFPAPEAVARVREQIQAADGLWVFTPEYNYGIPGVLKNLLDWLSRPFKPGNYAGGTAVTGKPVAISGAGGRNATASVRKQLDSLFDFMQMRRLKDCETGIALPAEAFGTDAFDITPEIEAQLKEQAEKFLKLIG